jgi:putative SOS response-associated peptidase YedK
MCGRGGRVSCSLKGARILIYSFYEWQTLADGVKQPYYIYMKDIVKKEDYDDKNSLKTAHAHRTTPMFFAAIYEHSLVHENVGNLSFR